MSKDFLKKYKKQKLLNNIIIILMSLIIALWINFFVIDKNWLWNNLKANILETKKEKNKADLYLEKNGNTIVLKNSKNLNNVKSLSFSLVFDEEKNKLIEISCNWNNLIKIWEQPWIKTIIINYVNKTINKNTAICNINIQKTNNLSKELNLINSNFTDNTWETYFLTTSGITF